MPTVYYPAAAPDDSPQPRALVLARQLVVDSSLELVHHPLRSTWQCFYETADQLCAAGQGEFGKRVLLPLQAGSGPAGSRRETPDPAVREEQSTASTGACLQPACIRLYPGGAEALAALHQVILQATSRIDVIMFLWEDDTVGRTIAAWLAARAGPDLQVRVLVDGGGNLMFGRRTGSTAAEVNRVVSALARQPHVEVLRTHNGCARFDHRKLVLVDGRAAWTGGRNFVQRSFFEQHDLSFVMTGPLVGQLEERFDGYWREQGGGAVGRGQSATAPEPGMTGPADSPSSPFPASCPPPANAWARLLETQPAAHELEQALYRAVDQASHHIYLENVYLADSRLVYKLAQARRRGADVRVVLTIASTNPVINAANRVTANRLRRVGVRVYLYPGMTHVKAAAIDGCWAYLGTGNLDALSFRHNRETGLAIGAGEVIEQLEERLLLAGCRAEWEVIKPLPATVADYACELLAGLYL